MQPPAPIKTLQIEKTLSWLRTACNMELEIDYQFKTFETIEDNSYLDIKQCVKDIIEKEGYVSCNVDVIVLPSDGSNFLGILCEINIKGKTLKEKKETNLFMKIINPDSQITIISLPDSYRREIFVYDELSTIFTELQEEIFLPQEERYKMVKSYDKSNPNAIILENMNKKGFKTIFRMDVITLQYAEMAIRELAKFHALSFVLETKRPTYFERKIKTMTQPLNLNEDWSAYVHNMCQMTLNYLDKDSRRKLQEFIPCVNEKYRKYLAGETGRRCLRHGDYRANNILVKETDGKVTEVIPIDYQLVSYDCPILDFCYFIFPATDQKFRRAHLQYLKELYYDTLKRFLNHFSLDVENIYPRNDFERDYNEMLDYGLMMSINLIPLLMACQNEIPDITKEPMSGISFSVDDKCRERIVGVVEDFIQWGYL